MHRLGLWLSLAFSAVAALALPASAAAVGWGPQFSVSGQPVEEMGAYAPEVVTDAAGDATYAWVEEMSGHRYVLESRVYGAGGGVGPVRTITGSEPGETQEFRLTADGAGQARLTWVQAQSSCSPYCYSAYQLKTVALGPDGAPAGEPVTIESFAREEAGIGNLVAAENGGGELAVAFSHYDYGTGESTIDVERVQGETVTDVTPTGEGPELSGTASVAINDSGTVFVVWIAYGEGWSNEFFGALIGSGLSGAAKPLTGIVAYNSGNLTALIDAEGNGTAVYGAQPEGLNSQVVVSRLSKDETASAEQFLSQESGGASDLLGGGAAVQGDGSVLVAWSQDQVVNVTRLAPDGTVGAAHAITAEGEQGWRPLLALGPAGDGVVIFETGEYPAYEIAQAPVDVTGARSGAVSALGAILSEEGYFDVYDLAVSASGNAAAAWEEEDETIEASQVFGALRDAIPPTITAWVPQKALAGEQTVLAASGTDANPISYEWSFGDGGSASGAVVPHVFATPGSYQVAVTATDSGGNSATKQATVEVVAAGSAGTGGGGNGGGGSGGGAPAPIVRPETGVLKAPPKKTRHRKVRVAFLSSVPGSSFECSLDRAGWKPCRSPLTLKRLKPGAHRLEIRAIGPDGVIEKEPTVLVFRVLEAKQGSRGSG